MEANESIRTDASTIHRLGGSDSKSVAAASAAGPIESIEEAQTVIRGSSRSPAGSQSWESADRTPAAVAKVLLGQRLNHFLLEELIGGGGMGAVFRARDEQLDRIVAIKVIPFVGEDPDLQRRFRNEAQSAAKLDHPNIARVFDVGSQDDWHYIVFEYIRGINIRDQVARDGPHSIDDAIFYTCQLADAIQHASERGIVHRDIKPSNVLIGDGDQVKLVDMGLARSENFELSEDMTASGVTLGTFDYISPEQARDPRDADVRSDIYSLGCTLYFMLTGRPPYPGGTMLQKLLSHGNAPPPDPRLLRDEVSDDLAAIIHKMLAKSPDDRYPSAGDLLADLKELANREHLIRAEGLGVVAPPPSITPYDWLERHLPWMVATAVLLASALWLQFLSISSRGAFSLDVPPSAMLPTPTSSLRRPPPVDPSPNSATAPAPSLDVAGTPVAPAAVGSEASKAMETAVKPPLFSDAAEPPTFTDVPLPRELPAGPLARSGALPGSDMALLPAAPSLTPPLAVAGLETMTLPAPERVRVIGADDPIPELPAEDAVAVTRSLAEAIQWAEQYGINRIEFATPLVTSEPVTIEQDGLVMTSLVGGTVLKFEPTENISMQRARMISIGANRIEFQKLHFHWTVQSSEIDGGTLIAMNDNKLVRLSDCTITIANPSRRDEVYAFEVVTDPEVLGRGARESTAATQAGSLPLVAIELENVIVRGEMTMIHMDFAAELQLQWDNGLLAVSRRMIDTAGALTSPSPTGRPILLSINRVTAYAPRGLVRMRLGVSGSYPVTIDREARNSVIAVDPGVPHFEISGLPTLSGDEVLVRLRGEANAYDAEPTLTDPVLSVSDQMGAKRVVRMSDLLNASVSWSDERSPRWAVRWSQLELPGVSPSQYSPQDFRQDGTVLSGFEERSLPRLPTLPDLPAASAPERGASASVLAPFVKQ